jgi:hypothetical protein
MAEEPHNLILDRLRELREEQRQLIADVRELKDSQTSIRHMLVAMQGDDLRQEAMLAGLRSDVDTIKRRLNLVEA